MLKSESKLGSNQQILPRLEIDYCLRMKKEQTKRIHILRLHIVTNITCSHGIMGPTQYLIYELTCPVLIGIVGGDKTLMKDGHLVLSLAPLWLA